MQTYRTGTIDPYLQKFRPLGVQMQEMIMVISV